METNHWQKNYYDDLSDEELCALYKQEGKQEIIQILLNRYHRYLISITLPFIHRLDSVGDFKMDLFFVLQKSLKISQPNIFKHWLGRVARNKMYDQLKKLKPELMETLPDRQLELADSWEFKLDFAEVLKAIEELKPDQRIYIEMAFFQGYKQSEIREVLGWSKDKPRKVRQNAIRNLNKILIPKKSDFIQYFNSS